MKTVAWQGSVLVVDDEPGFRALIQWELGRQGLDVDTAENGADAIATIKQKTYDVVITDLSMPLLDGLKLLREIKNVSPGTEVIVMTGFSTVETAVYAMQIGALDFVLKPFTMERISARVAQALTGLSRPCRCPRPAGVSAIAQASDPLLPHQWQ